MNWPTKQIGELFDLENGFAFKSADFLDEGVPVVKIKNVKAGYFSEHDFDYVSPDFRETRPSKLARVNDLLISMSGNRHDGSPETWVGKVAHFKKEGDYFLNQRVGALRLKPGLDENTRFFGYLMSSMPYQELFISIATSSGGQANLSPKQIFAAEVAVPSKKEQDAIARVLGSLDDKIELNRRMNETLEEMARALFRDWFVDFGPTRRQMDGATDPAAIMGHAFPSEKATILAFLFPAKLGDDGLPEGWSKQPVGELTEIVGGGTPSTKTEEFWEGGTHLWATPRDLSKLSGVFIGHTERKLTDAGLAKVSSGLSPAGSVLMSSRAPIGYLAVASRPVAVNQGFIVMRPTDQFPTHFAKLWCEANMETIEANANGSTFQEISKKNFKPILATVPKTEVMAAFVAIADTFFDKIEANERENQTLAELRDLLLPKLLSGEVRLSVEGKVS